MSGRLNFLMKLGCIGTALAMSAVSFSTTGLGEENATLRVPICTSHGVRFVVIDLGDQESPLPEENNSPCHGLCINGRKKILTTENELGRKPLTV